MLPEHSRSSLALLLMTARVSEVVVLEQMVWVPMSDVFMICAVRARQYAQGSVGSRLADL